KLLLAAALISAGYAQQSHHSRNRHGNADNRQPGAYLAAEKISQHEIKKVHGGIIVVAVEQIQTIYQLTDFPVFGEGSFVLAVRRSAILDARWSGKIVSKARTN